MKKIKDWKRILIDTTALCSLFRSEKSGNKNSHDHFVRKLITYLVGSKTSNNEERTLLVSSVTVAELITNEEDSEKIKRIMRILDSKSVEFVDFDVEIALSFNAQLKHLLNKPSLHKIASEIGFETNNYAMAREWISKDFMIIMCAQGANADIILTADKNTFYPVAKEIENCNCVLTYEELFDQSDSYILNYKIDEVDGLIKGLSKEKTATVKNTPQIAMKIENTERVGITIVDKDELPYK